MHREKIKHDFISFLEKSQNYLIPNKKFKPVPVGAFEHLGKCKQESEIPDAQLSLPL